MSDSFFANLDIPRPDVNLKVQSPGAITQIAEIMTRLEPVLQSSRPDCVVVVGDVNSTVAATLAAVKIGTAGRPRRGRSPQLRPQHAGGDQPDPDRRRSPICCSRPSRRPKRTSLVKA